MKKMSIQTIKRVAYQVLGVEAICVRKACVMFLIDSITSFRLQECNFPYYCISYSEYYESLTLTVFTTSLI